MKNKYLLFCTLILAGFAAMAQPGQGCPNVFDQGNTTSNLGTNGNDQFQVITCGITGKLTQIDIMTNGGSSYNYTLSVYSGSGVGGTLLYSAPFFNGGVFNNWLSSVIPVSVAPSVVSSQFYTIRIQSAGLANFVCSNSNPYNGLGYYSSDVYGPQASWDLTFRTWVQGTTYPPATITSVSGNTVCAGGSLNLNANTGSFSYQWWNSGSLMSGETNSVLAASSSGSYQVVVTNTNTSCYTTSSGFSVTAAAIPTNITNQTICSGTTLTLTSTSAATYTWNIASNSPSVTVMPVNTTMYQVDAQQVSGCITSTVYNITVNASPSVAVNAGTTVVNIGNAQTNVSDWSTIYYYFADPLPTGAKVTGYSLSYQASDQGWGGTGCGLTTQVSGDVVGTPILLHSVQSYSYSYFGAISGYTLGGTNYFGINFCGWGGWQAFLYNVSLTIHYTMAGVQTCTGSAVMLLATGANSYNWTGGVTNGVAFTPTANTVYTITGTNANSCQSATTLTLTINQLPAVTVSGPSTVCAGNSILLSASGANTFTWNTNGQGSTETYSPLTTLSYSVAGTNTLTGCSNTVTGNLSASPLPTITVPNYSVCFGNSATITPSGASTYTFSSGSAVVSPGSTTSYTISGTSAAGCDATVNAISVVNVDPLPAVSASANTVICVGGSATLTVGGADTYAWSNSATSSVIVVSPTTTTIYTVTGTYTSTGCSATTAVQVSVNPLPVLSVNNGSICNGSSYTLSPTGAFTYSYSSGSVVAPANTSTYLVSGTDLNSCTNTVIATVSVSPLPTISVSSGSICSGSVFNLVASGASSYTYSSGSSAVSPTITTSYSVNGTSSVGCLNATAAVATVTVYNNPVIAAAGGSICTGQAFTLSPGGASTYTYLPSGPVVTPGTTTTYSVSGTSTAGCQSTAPALVTVTVFATPAISALSGTICSGGVFNLSPSGANTYTITGPNTFTVSPPVTTTYTVSGTSIAGCTSTLSAQATVTVYNLPVISALSGTICDGSSFNLSPSGASTYTFSGGSAVVAPTITTSYSVTGTSTAGCLSSNTAVATVTVYNNPTISVSGGTICSGQSFSLIPSGAFSYTYLPAGPSVTPGISTSYSVSGSSTAGCVSTAPAVTTVTVFATPVISVNSGSICSGLVFTMTPGGAATYTISGPNTLTVSPPSSNTYTVAGTSTAGCTSTTSAIASVTVVSLPVISVASGTICNGNNFTLIPSGASTYTYSSGSAIVSPTITTSYSVTGTSSVGCVSAGPAVATVTVFNLPVIAVSGGTLCTGQSFTLNPTGANSYTYSPAGPVVSPGSNTTYSVSGTSTAGCVSALPGLAAVTVYTTPSISVNSGTMCFGNVFTLTPSGASTYTISGPNTLTVSPPSNATYTVNGTSTAGCTSTTSAVSVVTVYALPNLTASSGTVCQGTNFTITPGGALSYTYSSGSAVVNPSVTTSYSVTGTSTAGCTQTVPAISTVTVYMNPTVTVASGSICTGQSFTLSPNGAAAYAYLPTGSVVTPGSTTNYSVTGTSTAGCSNSIAAVATVTVYATPVISVNSGTICQGQTFTMTPGGAFVYNILPGNVPTVSPQSTTIYTVSGTSTAGCTSTTSATSTLVVYTLPTISVNSGTICQGMTFTMVPSGGSSYTFSSGSAIVNPMSTTSYSVSGSSTAGCIGTAVAISNVTVFNTPSITVNSGSICSGQTFIMSPSGATTYTFSNGSSAVSPLVSTSYSVSGTSSAGCNSSVFAVCNLTVETTPTITVNSGVICNQNSFTIVPAGANTYSIQGGSAIVSPGTTTNYTVVGYSPNGCPSSVQTSTVAVNQLPVILAGFSSPTLCIGAAITPTTSGASTYTWTGGLVTGTNFSPVASTSYTVSGTDLNNCTNSTTTNYTVYNLPVVTLSTSAQPACEAMNTTLKAAGGITYTWSATPSGTAGSLLITPTVSTSYTVTAADIHGCINTATLLQGIIVCPGTVEAVFSKTDVNCSGKKDGVITLTSNVSYQGAKVEYIWPSNICPDKTCLSADSLDAGFYNIKILVTYTLNQVLVKKDSVMLGPIEITDVMGPCSLTPYHGISPNGDGINDVLYIENIEQYPKNTVMVFNRWGELISEIKGYNNRDKVWPLQEDIDKTPSSTYFYLIDLGNGNTPSKGWLELMKH